MCNRSVRIFFVLFEAALGSEPYVVVGELMQRYPWVKVGFGNFHNLLREGKGG